VEQLVTAALVTVNLVTAQLVTAALITRKRSVCTILCTASEPGGAMRIAVPSAVLVLVTFFGACSVLDHSAGAPRFDKEAKWALLPIVNHTETAQAGLRAEAVAEALLRARGVVNLTVYPAALNKDTLFEPAERKLQDEALKWARGSGARYAVYGAVDEWRYKVGIDGEPAVGITLHVMDLTSGAVAWSGAGAKTGWSREALSAVAQKVIRELLAGAQI